MREGPFVVVCIKRIGVPYIVSVPAIGVFLIGLGQLLFWLNGVRGSDVLFRHWYIPIFVIGFVWVECVLCWAHGRYERTLREMCEVFDIPKDEYTKIVNSHLKSVYGEKRHVYVAIPLILGGIFYILASRQRVFWTPDFVFSEVLASPSMLGYFIFIVILAAVVGFTGMSEIILHIDFVRKLSNIPLNVNIFRVRRKTKLKELAELSGIGSITWFVGLALVSPVFVSVVNPITVSLFLIGLVVGIAMLAIPQFSLHGAVVSAKSKVIEELTRDILLVKDDDLSRILSIGTLFRNAEEIEEWPFGLASLAQQVISLAIPIVTYLLQLGLRPV